MTLLPLLQAPQAQDGREDAALPLYREAAWDFQTDRPVWRGGSPVWVTGADAVAVWVWNTVKTVRGERDLFSPDWGCQVQLLTGRPFSQAVKESEAARYLRDCLSVNPYILEVRQIAVELSQAVLSIRCAVNTIYGEVSVDVPGL